MVDLGIILSENIIKHIDEAPPGQKLIDTIYNGASEVATAILTAVSTTIVSFIPVFTMQAAEGKLFGPLAFTKSFALLAALIVSLLILPTLAHWFFGFNIKNKFLKKYGHYGLVLIGIISLFIGQVWTGVLLVLFGVIGIVKNIVELKNATLPTIVKFLLKYAE
jgi:Cu(I)/Ag(I) efflux system membrane protein CusA/SilA